MKKSNIKFTSILYKDQIEKLKELLFFNYQQEKIRQGIIASIEKYGLPEIIINKDYIRINVGKIKETQFFFAIEEQNNDLAGVIVYFRENEDTVTILHIAVQEKYSLSINKNSYVLLDMINHLKKMLKRVKGIAKLKIIYAEEKIGFIKIK